MSHTVHDFAQGTEAWHAHRRAHFNASEAPAMLGISQYQTRTDLLREKANGSSAEVSAGKQAIFDDGHRFEAAARPMAEQIIGQELYPIVASAEIDGLPLSASYDGATMAEDVIWEHKTVNQAINKALDDGVIPEQYRAQMEQQLLVIGATRCLFMASNGDGGSRHAWYESDPEMRARLLAGWRQFEADLKNYKHVEVQAAPAGKVIKSLPALSVQLVGKVKSSNLAKYEQHALAFIESINTNLSTDQDFADAEATVKFCSASEETLAGVKSQALAQTASIDELFRTIDTLSGAMRAKRLELEKLVKTRKDAIRDEIRRGALSAYLDHLGALNERLGKPLLAVGRTAPEADFAGAMKGKRTIATLRDAVDTELARVKIEATAIADRAQVNIGTIKGLPAEHAMLFPDLMQIAHKDPEDFATLVQLRVTQHAAAEQKRLEAERERIRQEEAEKLVQAPTAAPTPTAPATKPSVKPTPAGPRPSDDDMIRVLALHYRVHESKIIAWLLDADLDAASKHMAQEFAA